MNRKPFSAIVCTRGKCERVELRESVQGELDLAAVARPSPSPADVDAEQERSLEERLREEGTWPTAPTS